MTMIADQQRRELPGPRQPDAQQQAQQAAQNQARAAEQRNTAAAVHTAVAVARAEQQRARHLGAEERRWETAFQLLDEQINPRDERGERIDRVDMRVLCPENVLCFQDGPGTGKPDVDAVREFVTRTRLGDLPHDVLDVMHAARMELKLAGAVQHADASYQRAFALERAATVQPALPAGAAPSPSNGVPLPRREQPTAQPIAPSQPPLYPPAPPEAHPTGELIRVVEEELSNGARLAPQTVKALQDGRFGQSAEPVLAVEASDPKFAATAVPVGLPDGLKDTARMDLRELRGDGPLDVDDDAQAPRPFGMAASTAAPSPAASPAVSGSGDGDE